MIGRRIAHYDIESLLGRGGMGEVYRARDTQLGRAVAIKILPASFGADADRVSRFEREARVLAALNHPNIASIYGVEHEGDIRALVLELVEGPTLAERIARGPMPVAEALPIARQIAEAIETAHERGIIHRDLKPANVKLSTTGAAKVLDFGLAKMEATADESTAAHTEAGAVLGTAGYMSPEQARGVVDKRTDVWAFGCLLFEMLSGKPAFHERTWIETLTAIATREPDYSQLPADVPHSVRQLIERCLQKDPQVRLRDMGEARIALGSVISGEAPKIPPARPARPARSKLGTRAVLAGAALVILSVGGFALWRLRPSLPAGDRVEYTIAPPDGVHWGELPEDPWPRLSPDGRQVLFSGRSSNGSYGLWVRDVGAVSVQLLPDTSDAPHTSYSFWSPDGRAVAYCMGDHFKVIDLGGQPPRTIGANCFEDGSWDARSGILYMGDKGLHRVSGDGVDQQVTLVAPATAHWFPRWLPDGRRFIYTVRSNSDAKGEYLGSIDKATPKRLLPDATMTEYVAVGDRGYLVFVRTGRLMVWQVDPSTLDKIGEPVAIADRLAVSLSTTGAFAAAGSVLAYRRGASFPDATLVWMDRSGNRAGRSYADNTPVYDVALSHDEKTIAFGRFNWETTTVALWTADVASGIEQLISAPPTFFSGPVFSGDDRTIAASATLAVATARVGQTGMPVKLANGGGVPATWSADGRTILGTNSGGMITMLDLRKTPAEITRLHAGLHPQLSPDGQWLAYDSSETGAPQTWVEKFPGGTPKIGVSANGGFQPRWRNDQTELFFMTDTNDLMVAKMHIAPGGKTIAADVPTRLFHADFQPDGESFVRRDYAVTRDGQRFLIRMSGPAQPLTVVRSWFQGLK